MDGLGMTPLLEALGQIYPYFFLVQAFFLIK